MADSAFSTQFWCSKCKDVRDEICFGMLKSGKRRKICNRHGGKRELNDIFDDWDDFCSQLTAWNHPV